MIRQYRIEMNDYVDKYLNAHTRVFNSAFAQMNEAIGKDGLIEDIENFISANNQILQVLGRKPVITCIDDLEYEQHSFKL